MNLAGMFKQTKTNLLSRVIQLTNVRLIASEEYSTSDSLKLLVKIKRLF